MVGIFDINSGIEDVLLNCYKKNPSSIAIGETVVVVNIVAGEDKPIGIVSIFVVCEEVVVDQKVVTLILKQNLLVI